jgi:pyruvate kinase
MNRKNFKLIITLGPASLNIDFLTYCQKYNQNDFRLNCSHLTLSETTDKIDYIRKILKSEQSNIYLDLKGQKQRIGELPEPFKLEPGQQIHIIPSKQARNDTIPLPDVEMFNILEANDIILLKDGSIRLEVQEKLNEMIFAKVIQGGVLTSHAGIIVQDKEIPDQAILSSESGYLDLAKKKNIMNIALSYVTKAQEITLIRNYCQQNNYSPRLTAKIERPEALQNIKHICDAADEIWYCRGDLGTFIPFNQLAFWQEEVIRQAKSLKKQVLIAGQVFQYLTHFPEPTRSEIIHFSSLLKMGVDGIVLSDETAIGQNPETAVRQTQSLIDYDDDLS